MRAIRRPAFLRDVSRYAFRIARDSPEAVDRFITAAEETCDNISRHRHPQLGHAERFRKIADIRSFRISGFDKYLILYRVNPDSVEFVRLIHGARDLPRFFKA